MDIHEKFSQTRSSRRTSLILVPETSAEIEAKEHFGVRPGHVQAHKARQEKEDLEKKQCSPLQSLEDNDEVGEFELDASEREAMERFEEEHPGWARFDVDIVIKTVVYAGIGWLAVDTIPVMFEYIGLGTSSL